MAAEEQGAFARREMRHMKYHADGLLDEERSWTVQKGEFVSADHPARKLHPEAMHWSGSHDEALQTDRM